ncbi:MAG TPA: adenylate/guanylate cyclase domain-containing protein [Candidatus Limnocylindria bacterium]|nr:adenylate/guanylate cyclase domain-containing protein [Candidatus Limnocylindria bacterium]
MAICGQCGRESPDDFGFCPGCGAPLGATPVAREVRKVVTVLFCDLTGSTEIGDRTDPEALRSLMRRYYETARVVLERHGGTVEKFVGDAVMAVFGIPVATEDDALRAIRAAVELRDTVHALGLEARIGVNTGDVVAGEGDTLVTGDAVNVAARLEQSAGAGEILLGDATMRLVRDAGTMEPVDLSLKGKAGHVTAHRLVALDPAAAGFARRFDSPLVGRERERERLRADFADAVASRACRLFTLIGPAGVGKSRLVADFLDGVGEAATVARGRALSYGEGITYWPLVEMLIQLGVEPSEAIRSSPADTQLATRAIFERLAEERPLVLVIDDLQWAEAPLLDMVEHIVDWSRDAPIFVLCIGRPELLDVRPGWGGGKVNATALLLEPLGEAESTALADGLLAGLDLDAETRARILAIAEGNPLFLEEMAALAREADGTVSVPPTIRALLQARLDTLNEAERAVIERGAVEGKVFHRGAVTALAPESSRDGVPGQLLALVRKELVRPDRSQIVGDDAFRFRHLLIRDTAYDSLPKAVRAELHERFAEWLDAHGDLLEQDELVGYHLEHSAQFRGELEPDDPRAVELGARAAARLGRAGVAALERGDTHAATGLLSRAHALLAEGAERRRIIPDLVQALVMRGERARTDAFLDELDRGDDVDQAHALALRLLIDPLKGGETIAELDALLAIASDIAHASGDPLLIGRCAHARGWLAWTACQTTRARQGFLEAFDAYGTAGRRDEQLAVAGMINASAAFSGTSIPRMRSDLLSITRILRAGGGPLALAQATLLERRLDFMAGECTYEDVLEATESLGTLLRQTGSEGRYSHEQGFLVTAAALDGRLEEAARLDTERTEAFQRMGDMSVYANALGDVAIHRARLGDADGAMDAVERARAVVRDEDIADRIMIDLGEAMARATRGEVTTARALIDRARATAEGIDMVLIEDQIDEIDALVSLAAGDVERARRLAAGLVEASERRGGMRVAEARRRQLLEPAIAAAHRAAR